MSKYLQCYQSLLESLSIKELLPNTKFSDLKSQEKIKAYRSSARSNKTSYESGSHAGTLQQALIRADYFLNDEESHDKYYLYELEINLGRIYPKLESDSGENHGNSYYADLSKEYDTIIYKNSGEGDIQNENLSLIILNPLNIISHKMIKVLTKEQLLSLQKELYGLFSNSFLKSNKSLIAKL